MTFQAGRRPDSLAIGDEALRRYREDPAGPTGFAAIAALAIMAVARVGFALEEIAESLRASEPAGRP